MSCGSDEQALEAWARFDAREVRARLPADDALPLEDLTPIVTADAWFRGLADAPEEFSLDCLFEYGRAIFDHPLRSIFPVLLRRAAHPAEDAASFRQGGVTYGLRVRGDRKVLFVDNQFGLELLSAEVDGEGRLNAWSLRVLGLLPHELLFLGPADAALLPPIFNSRFFQQATELTGGRLDDGFPERLAPALRQMAQLPLFFAAVSTNGCGPQGFLDFVPDSAFARCCDAHDTCYARGGTEQDRARCDEDLARCIEAVGGSFEPGGFAAGAVATLYWLGVTLFGGLIFSYGPKQGPGVTDATSAGEGMGGTGPTCSWTLSFVDLTVRNAPAGGRRIQPEIIVDFEKQIRTNPDRLRKTTFPEVEVRGDTTRSFTSAPVPSKYGVAECGSPVVVPILVREVRSGEGTEQSTRFPCDGGRHRFTIQVAIGAMTLGYNFEVVTACS